MGAETLFNINFIDRYKNNSVLRGLIQLVPFGIGSGIDVALSIHIDEIKHKRMRIFFDELGGGNIQLSQDLIESEDFLHCYFATLKAAMNSRRKEKIEMFARLLKSTISDEKFSSTDEFEEYLKILDELSYREFMILLALERHESENPQLNNENELQRATRFWNNFVSDVEKIGISVNEIDSILNRLNRSGCYETFVGGYLSYTGGKGKTTPTFKRLKRLIEVNNSPA